MKRFENYLDQDDDFTTAALTSWNNAKDELGAYRGSRRSDVLPPTETM
ncbi:MAG: hypothetical protein ACLR6B_01370 [Blautia sp.]